MPTKSAQRAALNKQRVIDVALGLFAARGYTATSLQAIAEEADVSRGSITWYFGSKDGLLFAVVDRAFARWESDVLGPLLRDASGPRRLAEVVTAHLEFVKQSPALGRLFFVLFFEALAGDAPLRAQYAALHERFRGYGRAWLQRAVDAGAIPADVDPEAASAAIVGALGGAHYQWILDPARVDIERVERELAKVLERGFARRGDGAAS